MVSRPGIFLFLLCLCLLGPALPGRADNTVPAVAVSPSPDAPALTLTVARNGNEVLLNWDIPPLDIRGVELMRHTRREQTGRNRVAAVHARPGLYTDQVPDASATYWYWLKVTLANGQVLGAGPIPTPTPEVWQPAP